MPPTYKIYHKDIDGNPIDSADGNLVGGFLAPIGLTFEKTLKEISTISYGISLSDQRFIKHDWVSPYKHDFLLVVNDGVTYKDTVILQGVITDHELQMENGLSQIAGQDYLHLLDRLNYPFDPTIPDPYPYKLEWENQTLYQILTDIFNNTVETGWGSELTYSQPMYYNFNGILFASDITKYTQNYRIQYGDTTSLYSFLKTFSDQYPGFDFAFEYAYDFTDIYSAYDTPYLQVYVPERSPEHTPIYSFRIDRDGNLPGVTDLKWHNSGPGATHALGTGAGGSFWQNYNYQPAADLYRRLDIAPDFGDVPNLAELQRATAGALGHALAPIYELTLTVNPEFIKTPYGFWKDFDVGQYFFIKKDLQAHLLDGLYKIIQMQATVDTEGQASVVLNCNRETNLSLFFSDDTP